MKTFCWAITVIACLVSGLLLFMTLTSSNGAPQEAAGAAMAAAVAIIPYVFSRAVTELSGSKAEDQNEQIISLLKTRGTVEDKAQRYDAAQSQN